MYPSMTWWWVSFGHFRGIYSVQADPEFGLLRGGDLDGVAVRDLGDGAVTVRTVRIGSRANAEAIRSNKIKPDATQCVTRLFRKHDFMVIAIMGRLCGAQLRCSNAGLVIEELSDLFVRAEVTFPAIIVMDHGSPSRMNFGRGVMAG